MIGFWTRHSYCSRVVQSYAEQNGRLFIACEHSAVGLTVSYLNQYKSIDFPDLCISVDRLEQIIGENLLSISVPLPQTSDLTTVNERSLLSQEIRRLYQQLRNTTILIVLEQLRIHLFGFADKVRDVQQRIEQMKANYLSNTVQLNLEPRQVENDRNE